MKYDYDNYTNCFEYRRYLRKLVDEHVDMNEVRYYIDITNILEKFTDMRSVNETLRKVLTVEEIMMITGPELYGISQKKSYYGNIPGYSDEFSIRRPLILDRDRDQCMLCGEYDNLVVHHIDCNKFNNHPTNLIVLDRPCHHPRIHPTVIKKNKKNIDWLTIKRLTKIAVKRSNIFFAGEGLPAKYEKIFENIKEIWS